MKRMLAVTALITSGLLSVPAMAQDTLSGDAIRSLIAGKNILLATPYGLEFPLQYRADGKVVGDASGFRLASMFAPKETGRWWVEGNRLCQQWPSWYDGKRLCFTVEKTGANAISWVREDGLKGTARIQG